MNAEIKARWVDALRSGDFKQGTEYLVSTDEDDGGRKFCCLGVLCVIFEKETGSDWKELAEDNCEEILPPIISEWAGLSEGDPHLPNSDGNRVQAISGLNDGGMSFEEIADRIEKHL
jgi:hypothetical protein